ncbi:MAG TPA: hypothetical protein VGL99_10430 [Chloroflexota bacterium]
MHWLLEQPLAEDRAIRNHASAREFDNQRAKVLGSSTLALPPAFEAFVSSPEPGGSHPRRRVATWTWPTMSCP